MARVGESCDTKVNLAASFVNINRRRRMSHTQITVSPPSAPSTRTKNEKDGVNKEGKNEPGDKLMVVLRIRPLKHEEKARGYKCVAEKVDDKMVVLSDANAGNKHSRHQDHLRKKRSSERQYLFDAAFGADSTQAELYAKTTQPLVQAVLEGYNATVFAYGATGAGKTYTMVGTPNHPGCMARALNEMFEVMDKTTDVVFKVTMSYLEIYNENIRDLLNPSSGSLDLRDDSGGKNIHVAGLSEVATKNTDEVMRLLQKGNKERTQEPTAANKTSSRSHALLMVNVKQTAKSRAQSKGAVKFGRLYMIDLAGSERAAQTENRGKRLKEGAHINRSLLALGNVINALAEHKAKSHVNYRDSKLTRLLKDALSGNCHTVMIAHISPADRNRDESRNTLVYADRAKNISNKVRRNVLDVSYHVSQYQNIISELRGEIGRLKEKIQVEGTLAGPPGSVGARKQAQELQELRDQMVANFKDQMGLRHRLMEIDNHILSLSMEFERQNIIINEYETEKAKNSHDRAWKKKQRKAARKANNNSSAGNSSSKVSSAKIAKSSKSSAQSRKATAKSTKNEPEAQNEANNEEEDKADNEESGFEDNGSATADDEDHDADAEEEEDDEEDEVDEVGDDDKSVKQESQKSPSKSDSGSDEEDEEEQEEPDEVKQAWDELVLIQREQNRYSDIKYDLEQDLEQCKKRQARFEDELPKRISTEEEAEILSLLCKVHELEIGKVEMQRDALLKDHEVRKRDLLILKFDKQRALCDEIIDRQRVLIEGQALPMPPELMDLYTLYKQELESRNINEKEHQFVTDLNQMIRAPSLMSLRGPDFEDKSSDRLPPIKQEPDSERLFQSRDDLKDVDEEKSLRSSGIARSGSQLSLRSPTSSAHEVGRTSPLPPIDNEEASMASSRAPSRNSRRESRSAERGKSKPPPGGKSGIPVYTKHRSPYRGGRSRGQSPNISPSPPSHRAKPPLTRASSESMTRLPPIRR